VRVSPPTDDESVMQIFGGNSGATTQMIRAYNVGGGTLRKVPGSVVLAENIHGTWIKVNVIHDVGGNFVKTYINGKLVTMGDGEATNAGTDGWYHKYGCYGTLRTGTAKVEWRNVKHFRDGDAPSGNAPPPADAGAKPTPADAGGDPVVTPDAGSTGGSSGGGTGGSSGSTGGTSGGSTGGTSGGTGGKSGTGGAPGTGGKPATGDTGGSGGDEEEPAPPKKSAAKGGCSYGGGTGGFWALAVLGLIFAARRRQAR
jgi:MYXO-CTERM domain-containing protein